MSDRRRDDAIAHLAGLRHEVLLDRIERVETLVHSVLTQGVTMSDTIDTIAALQSQEKQALAEAAARVQLLIDRLSAGLPAGSEQQQKLDSIAAEMRAEISAIAGIAAPPTPSPVPASPSAPAAAGPV